MILRSYLKEKEFHIMLELKKDMLLFHGSYIGIKDINLSKCMKGKDFGRGFYVTTSLEQAMKFSRISTRRAVLSGIVDENQNYGFVNTFRLASTENIKFFAFNDADVNWLHFVVSNRDETLFQDENKKYEKNNVIAGKIANDKTATTLQTYIDGINGRPGDIRTDRLTIEALLPNRLENQFCFKSTPACKCLKYESEKKYVFE